MDSVLRIYGQIADLVRAMTPRARAAAAALLIVAVASMLYLARRELAGDTTYLLAGQEFSLHEITVMQGALGKAKLNDFVVDGNRIRIPRAKQAAYLAALADGNALPQTLTDIFSEASDRSTWFTSRQQQLDHTRTAKKKALSLILRSMNGVESAEVDFEKEEPRGLKRERVATALVAVKLQSGQSLSEDRAVCFQRMTAAALTMSPHDVTVVDKNNHLVFGGRGSGTTGDDVYRDLKRKYQADYEESVRRALAYVPGITVSADVELERELRREVQRIEFDADSGSTARRAASTANQGSDLHGNTATNDHSGSNQPAQLATSGRGTAEPTPRVVVREDATPAQNQTKTEIAGLTPKRVAISVGVPTSHFESVWRRQQSAGSALESYAPSAAEFAQLQTEEIARIRQHVAGLIPGARTAGDGDRLVTVTPFSHADSVELPAESLSSLAVEWLATSWTTIATLGVAFVAVLALRSMLRGVALARESAQTNIDREFSAAEAMPAPTARFRAELEKKTSLGRSLREEVADIVREDPAAAANILRSWMGTAQR